MSTTYFKRFFPTPSYVFWRCYSLESSASPPPLSRSEVENALLDTLVVRVPTVLLLLKPPLLPPPLKVPVVPAPPFAF